MGILLLPNEILVKIFDYFKVIDLQNTAISCKQLHDVVRYIVSSRTCVFKLRECYGFFLEGLKHGLFTYTSNGKIIKQANYQYDQLHGDYMTCEDNIVIKCRYRRGLKHGPYSKYRYDMLEISAGYKDDMLHGEYIEYLLDGSVSKREYYKYGKIDGLSVIYNKSLSIENSNHMSRYQSIDSNAPSSNRYQSIDSDLPAYSSTPSSNRYKLYTYKNGLKDGYAKIYIDKDRYTICYYQNNELHGIHIEQYGCIRYIKQYDNNILHGICKRLVNGCLTDIAKYEYGELHGISISYYDNGNKRVEITYSRGDRVKKIIYYSNGYISAIYNYIIDRRATDCKYTKSTDVRHGIYYEYYLSGKVKHIGIYKYGERLKCIDYADQ